MKHVKVGNDALQILAQAVQASAGGLPVASVECPSAEAIDEALAYAEREAVDAPRSFEDAITITLGNLLVAGTRIAYALEQSAQRGHNIKTCTTCGCTIVSGSAKKCPVCSHTEFLGPV